MFCGNFSKVKRIFGVALKFESFGDLLKALKNEKYGSWPRCAGEGNYIKNDNGTIYEGDIIDYLKEGLGSLYSPRRILIYTG